jgi:ribosomal protein S17
MAEVENIARTATGRVVSDKMDKTITIHYPFIQTACA